MGVGAAIILQEDRDLPGGGIDPFRVVHPSIDGESPSGCRFGLSFGADVRVYRRVTNEIYKCCVFGFPEIRVVVHDGLRGSLRGVERTVD